MESKEIKAAMSKGLPVQTVSRDLPADDYHAMPAMSKSRLSELDRSPSHFIWSLEHPKEATPDMMVGTAAHAAILEPDVFVADYICRPEGLDGRTKDGRAWLAENEAKICLTTEQWRRVVGMVEALESPRYRTARDLLTGTMGANEVSLFWMDQEHGVQMKARLDRLHVAGILVDLKTTQGADLRSFERTIFNFKYHWQAAIYIDGAIQCGLVPPSSRDFVFVAIESKGPHEIGIYRLEDEVIKRGREEYRDALKLYKQCMELQVWPGYPDTIQDIGLPRWA